MRTLQRSPGTFQKVGECLYRYSSNGVYYARIKSGGKEIRRSLETTDRDTAKRELARLRKEQRHIDRSDCQYTKYFTKPVPLESAGKCPRCKGSSLLSPRVCWLVM